MAFLNKFRRNRVGMDIGGTLTKIAAYTDNNTDSGSKDSLTELIKNHTNTEVLKFSNNEGGRLYLTKLEDAQELFSMLKQSKIPSEILPVTGGGIYKFKHELAEAVNAKNPNVKLINVDEMESTANGI